MCVCWRWAVLKVSAARQAVLGRGDFWGGEERRLQVGALARINI